MSNKHTDKIFATLAKLNPEPTTDLEYASTFQLLVAVILSAQATDVSVNLATKELFKIAKTPAEILKLQESGLIKFIKSIGLFNTKAKNIIKTCEMLLDLHDGQVPSTRVELEKLPGVGRKTANVVLNVAFGKPTIAVDTHIFRVSNRTAIAPGKNPIEVELNLLKVVPAKYLKHAHHWLILHGRYTCTARKPNCGNCSIAKYCDYYQSRDAKTN